MVYSGYMVDTFILLHSLWMFMEVFLDGQLISNHFLVDVSPP